MYNSTLNQWERLLEPGETGKPVQISLRLGTVDMTQVLDNMEETPLVTEGEEGRLYVTNILLNSAPALAKPSTSQAPAPALALAQRLRWP